MNFDKRVTKQIAMQGVGEERIEVYCNTSKEYRSQQHSSAFEVAAEFLALARKQAATVVNLS